MRKKVLILFLLALFVTLFPITNKAIASSQNYTYKSYYKADGTLDYRYQYKDGKRYTKTVYTRDNNGKNLVNYIYVYKPDGNTIDYKYQYKNGKRSSKTVYIKDRYGKYQYNYIYIYKPDGNTINYKYQYKNNKRISKTVYTKDNNGKYHYNYIYIYKSDGNTINYKYQYKNDKRISKTVYTKDNNGKYHYNYIYIYKSDGNTIAYKYQYKNDKRSSKTTYTLDSNGKYHYNYIYVYKSDGSTINYKYQYKNDKRYSKVVYIKDIYGNYSYTYMYIFDNTGTNIINSYLYKNGEFVNLPLINNVTSNKSGTQSPGTNVTWTANSQGSNLTYYWYVYHNGSIVKESSTSSKNYFSYTLNNAGNYYVKVKVKDSFGNSKEKSSNSIKVESQGFSVPTGLSANALSSGVIEISWNKVSGATYYDIYRRIGNIGDFEHWDSTDELSYSDTYLDPSTTYYYKVEAVNDSAKSGQSQPVSATTKAQVVKINSITPNMPSPQPIGTKITWTANVKGNNLTYYWDIYTYDSSSDEWTFEYEEYESTSNKLIYTPTHTGNYYVDLRVEDDLGNWDLFETTPDSEFIEIISNSTQKLPAPKDLSANALSHSEIEISWNSVSDATYYNIYRKVGDSSNFEYWDSTDELSINDTDLDPSTTYHYKVKAVNDSNSSEFTPVVSATTKEAVVKINSITPNMPSQQPIGTEITWTADVKGSNLTYYWYVFTYDSSKDEWTSEYDYKSTSNKLVYTPTHTGNYYVDLYVEDNLGNSDLFETAPDSEYMEIVDKPVQKLPSPEGLNAEGLSHTEIKVTWNKVNGATKYKLYRRVGNTGNFDLIETTNNLSYNDKNLKPNTTYYYKIQAINDSSSSDKSSPKSATTNDIPLEITSVTADKSSTQIVGTEIKWTASTSRDVTHYKWSVFKEGSSTPLNGSDASWVTRSYIKYKPSTSGNYRVKVEVKDSNGVTAEKESEWIQIKDKQVQKLPAPEGLNAEALSESEIKITWKSVDDATKYNLYRKVGSGEWLLFEQNINDTKYNDTNLSPNTKYSYKVVALNDSSSSDESLEAFATTQQQNMKTIINANLKHNNLPAGAEFEFSLTVHKDTTKVVLEWYDEKETDPNEKWKSAKEYLKSNLNSLPTYYDNNYEIWNIKKVIYNSGIRQFRWRAYVGSKSDTKDTTVIVRPKIYEDGTIIPNQGIASEEIQFILKLDPGAKEFIYTVDNKYNFTIPVDISYKGATDKITNIDTSNNKYKVVTYVKKISNSGERQFSFNAKHDDLTSNEIKKNITIKPKVLSVKVEPGIGYANDDFKFTIKVDPGAKEFIMRADEVNYISQPIPLVENNFISDYEHITDVKHFDEYTEVTFVRTIFNTGVNRKLVFQAKNEGVYSNDFEVTFTVDSRPTINAKKGFNNVIYYSQVDEKWKNIKYGYGVPSSDNIGSGGCGPTSAAMVLSTLLDKEITPLDMAIWSANKGYRAYDDSSGIKRGNGTYGSFFDQGLKKYLDNNYPNHGIKITKTYNIENVKLALTKNQIVVANPKSSKYKSGSKNYFTNGGHFIVLTGIEGSWIHINDPNAPNAKVGGTAIWNATKTGIYKAPSYAVKSDSVVYWIFSRN